MIRIILALIILSQVADARTLIRKEQIEDAYVLNTGDTMSSDLIVSGTVEASSNVISTTGSFDSLFINGLREFVGCTEDIDSKPAGFLSWLCGYLFYS